MNSTWLRTGDGGEVHVFALGWGQTAAAVPPESLPAAGDVLALHEWHRDGALPSLDGYGRRNLIAWSFGVWAAARLAAAWDRALAVNGTLTPVDAECGIAPEIFNATVEQWRPRVSAAKFWRRMGAPSGPERRDADLLEELEYFAAAVAASPEAPNCYGAAWIGRRDRIFSAENQCRSWARHAGVAVHEFDWPHWCGSEVWREAVGA